MGHKDYAVKVLMLAMPWYISARVLSAPRQFRLSLAESMPSYYYNNIDGHPGTYAFGYDVSDASSGNIQSRSEERYPNGTVVGSYGYVDPNGRPHRYRYIADERGYRVMRVQPRQAYYSNSPAVTNPNAIPNDQRNEVTWTRRKPNNS